MTNHDERADAASLCEDIRQLARKYLDDADCGGIGEIERRIGAASAEARWDEMSKWHRVRLRYLRFERERRDAARFQLPGESAA